MTKPLLVLGARQVGKTYLIDAFCKAEYRRYRQINLFREPLLAQIYQSELSSARKFEQLQLLAGFNLDDPDTILFIDEVQESEDFIADLKFVQEEHPMTNIVCAGSLLGVKLKKFGKPFPVGKITIRQMSPMSFPEFLMAVGKHDYIQVIQQCYLENTKMIPALHEEMMQTLRTYLGVGGMPEAVQHLLDVNADLIRFDRAFYSDLKSAYANDMKKYVNNQSEAVKIERLYDSIPMQQANKAHKFQYSKIRSGARASIYETALDWLMAADLVYQVHCVTNPIKPVRYYADPDVFKLFLNDTGMLTHSLDISLSDIMLDRLGQAKGLLAENFVACELKSADVSLHYWRSANNAEVDFIVETTEGVIPIEVKSAENVQSKSLQVFTDKYEPTYAIRISTKNFGYTNNIKSIPLYAAFCLASETWK